MLEPVRAPRADEFFASRLQIETLRSQVLPLWLKAGAPTFTAWSATCGAGEEAYSLAAALSLFLPRDRNFKILATDADTRALNLAENAVYPLARWRELPETYRPAFTVGRAEVREWFRVRQTVREKITFKEHALTALTYPGDGIFDLIVCATVDPAIIAKLRRSLKPSGFIFLGDGTSSSGRVDA